MGITMKAAAALLAIAPLAGCASARQPAAAPPGTLPAATAAATSPAPPGPSPSPAQHLTRLQAFRQAGRTYLALVDPSNRAIDAVKSDQTDGAPMAQFRADVRAVLAAYHVLGPKLLAYRWPPRVGPYVRAMVTTDMAADIRCYQELAKARSYAQVNTLGYNRDCTADTGANATQIRAMLRLPPLG